MKSTFFKSVVVTLSVVLMVACGKKKDDSAEVNGGRDARVASGPSNLPTNQNMVAGQQGATVNQPNQQALDEAAKILVSVTVDPQTVGTIQNVTLQGRVRVDRQTGAVLSDGSNINNTSAIRLTIHDSLVGTSSGQGQIQPILVELGGGINGATAQGTAANYNANLQFSDKYGTITITGRYDSNTFQGTVAFANNGGGFNGKTSGTLGTFSIQTCAFFVCQ